MASSKIFHQKITLEHNRLQSRTAIFEIVVWCIPKSKDYPTGVKYRAWLSEEGMTLLGFDNHKPKGPHLHVREFEVGYVFRGIDELLKDIKNMIEKEGFVYEE
jgi:hypothetical protein